jgi:eukaryotic-like serine/threonine-protein kinase
MTLTVGTNLGPYEVLGALGAGGMGEVYRARDTRPDRTVAIKILPEHLSSDPGRRARFEREARAISGLSHPNICALFDIGDQNGIHYVVLEYLEGRTLADRLAKGPLPVSEVLKVGADLASALEAAHRQGIVHRDLKPANVMLTKTGAKLLDFGLAKPSAALAPAAAVDAPTLSKSLTEEGVIVGTFRYMAPEQLEGKDTDGRTDIFALGVLLYEMGTGRSAFSGASRASIIAAIMSSEPAPISALQPLSPPGLDRVVQTCLAKEPDERWQTAHDVRLQLEWIRDAGSQAGVPRVKGQRRITRELIAWASALFLLLAFATTFVMRYFQPSSPPPQKIMFTVEPPPGYKPTPEAQAALSPDGALIAYAVTDAKGNLSLWLRALE